MSAKYEVGKDTKPPPTPPKKKKQLGWFSRYILRRKPPPDTPRTYAEAAVNTTEFLLDRKKVRQALAVSNLARDLQPIRKIFSAWSTWTREKRRDRLQYYGESLQEIKQANYEVRIVELLRERDSLRQQVEEYEKRESGAKFLLAVELPEEVLAGKSLDDSGGHMVTTTSPRHRRRNQNEEVNSSTRQQLLATDIGTCLASTIAAEQAVAQIFPRVPEEEDRSLWTAPRRIVELGKVFSAQGSSANSKLEKLHLSGPLRLELLGPETCGWMSLVLSGSDCVVKMSELRGEQSIDVREGARLEVLSSDAEKVAVSRGGRFFAKQCFIRGDVTQYDPSSCSEFSDCNFSARVQILDGFFRATRCKFLDDRRRVDKGFNSAGDHNAEVDPAEQTTSLSADGRIVLYVSCASSSATAALHVLELFLLVLRRWWLLPNGEDDAANVSPTRSVASVSPRSQQNFRNLSPEMLTTAGATTVSPRGVHLNRNKSLRPKTPAAYRQRVLRNQKVREFGAAALEWVPHPCCRRSCLCVVEQCLFHGRVLVKGRGAGLLLDEATTSQGGVHLQDEAVLIGTGDNLWEAGETELPAERLWSLEKVGVNNNSPTNSPRATMWRTPRNLSPRRKEDEEHDGVERRLQGKKDNVNQMDTKTVSPSLDDSLLRNKSSIGGNTTVLESPPPPAHHKSGLLDRSLDTVSFALEQQERASPTHLVKRHNLLPHVRGDRSTRFLTVSEALGVEAQLLSSSSKVFGTTADAVGFFQRQARSPSPKLTTANPLEETPLLPGKANRTMPREAPAKGSFEELMLSCKKHQPRWAAELQGS
ncbi:unnamed protein product [Amoebophrya sp. A120]|nr:unnamed protein product [Amoebophrya sp. A120]|eukprot:GSA120T00018890001.1